MDRARAARRAEARLRAGMPQRRQLPLYGIPFAIKDNIDCRSGHHRRLPAVRLPAQSERHGRRAARRGGRDSDRQGESRPVRHRPGRGALALRRAREQLRSRLHPRRLQLGLGGRGRGRARELQPRHRHRRLGARPCRVQQHRRPQAHPRAPERPWRGAGVPLARLRLDLRPHRRGRCRRAARGAGLRRGRSFLAPCRFARARPAALVRQPAVRRTARGSAPVLRQLRNTGAFSEVVGPP